jgi:LmbE family N-acetylglucosaminyl deacetylase
MINLRPHHEGGTLRLLCLGAHSDDIEIGCGGTVLQWLSEHRRVEVTWAVLSAVGPRAREAQRSARALLRGAVRHRVVLGDFDDGHFPGQFREIKGFVEQLKAGSERPHIVFTHRIDDRHQDHRLLGELTWQTWRDHLILEYEIPKYEGDLGLPNAFVPLARSVATRKVRHLMRHFSTQRSKAWFRPSTFESLMQLRGIETRAESGFSEAFHVRKLQIAVTPR